MNRPFDQCGLRIADCGFNRRNDRPRFLNPQSAIRNPQSIAGFTMVEIALCLAIIGFALLSILLVLPGGMNTQRQTREETIIGQDASVLLEAIRNGARGADDLTNYVYAIVNTGTFPVGYLNPALAGPMNFPNANAPSVTWHSILTNGANIVGLLSMPEFVDANAYPLGDLSRGYSASNHITAYVRSISGLAAEKPPQNNAIMVADTFSYRLYCVNAPMAADTNTLLNAGYARQLAGNLRELRLTFLWPQLPNGSLPASPFRQTFRSSIGGQLLVTNVNNSTLYYYQSQSFTNAP